MDETLAPQESEFLEPQESEVQESEVQESEVQESEVQESEFLDPPQESILSLSPCTSCETMVDDSNESASSGSASTAPPHLKILLPNLTDHILISVSELQTFVYENGSPAASATIIHLLIYLFAKKVHPDIGSISNLKLLHIGRSYWVGQSSHLYAQTPLIQDIVETYPTFQLLICQETTGFPVQMSIHAMMSQCGPSGRGTRGELPPATYAEAIARKFRATRRSLRKSSVSSVESPSPRATRFLSRGSATDTEEGSASVTTLGLKRSLRKIMRRTRDPVNGPSDCNICV